MFTFFTLVLLPAIVTGTAIGLGVDAGKAIAYKAYHTSVDLKQKIEEKIVHKDGQVGN